MRKRKTSTWRKGTAFERWFEKQIREVLKLSKSDCYRTPGSGGIRHLVGSDIYLSESARAVFPFYVECKHWRTWRLDKVMFMHRTVKIWLHKLLSDGRREPGQIPLLVARGHRTESFAIMPVGLLPRGFVCSDPVLYFRYGEDRWAAVPVRTFLSAWKDYARKKL